MRYTTIIDYTEIEAVNRCQSAVVMYIHFCLKCGYHDKDRDIYNGSLRQIAERTHLTLSAVRHAMRVLASAQLITIENDCIHVKKWIARQAISERKQEAKRIAEAKRFEAEERDRQEAANKIQAEKEQYKKTRQALAQQGKSILDVRIERLEAKASQGDKYAIKQLQELIRERDKERK